MLRACERRKRNYAQPCVILLHQSLHRAIVLFNNMGLGVRVSAEHAEKVRVHLLGKDNQIAHGYRILQANGFITFPVKDSTSQTHIEAVQNLGSELVEYEHVVPDSFGWNSLAKNLEGIIDESEAKHFISSYDVIGDIAAIEIPYLMKYFNYL